MQSRSSLFKHKKKFYSLRLGLSRSNFGLLLKLCVSLNSPGFIQMSLLLSGSALFQILFGNFSVALLENNPLLRGKKKLYGKVEGCARGFGRITLENFLRYDFWLLFSLGNDFPSSPAFSVHPIYPLRDLFSHRTHLLFSLSRSRLSGIACSQLQIRGSHLPQQYLCQ